MRLSITIFLLVGHIVYGQNKTENSLFIKADSLNYLTDIGSESGDLFEFLGHHGPAIENEWMGLRLYFNENTAIDVYSKSKLGLELREARWYPTVNQQKNGWGSDYYKAGSTVGLGGVRLWDGEKVIKLNPVTSRFARVAKTDSTSYMEMISKGISYKGKKIDLLVRVTVFSGKREAKVEAMTVGGELVQFATGINYHQGFKTQREKNFIATWGKHPEDVAADIIEIGAAILYNPDDYLQSIDDGTQYLLISKPLNYLETTILSASSKEEELNTLDKLVYYIK
ncbi:MAG: DUF4861 family protein [Maribacter sp.]